MLDTVRFATNVAPHGRLPSGWTRSFSRVYETLEEKHSDLRVVKNRFLNTWEVEVSLSRLLFGEKKKQLIRSNEQIQAALAKATKIATQVAPDPVRPITFKRVDLSLQFEGEMSRTIERLWKLEHPRCRRGDVMIFRNASITWISQPFDREKVAGLRILLYDPHLKQTGRYSSRVVRAECQLRSTILERFLGRPIHPLGGFPTDLDLESCYSAFRRIMCEFDGANLCEPFSRREKRIDRLSWSALLPPNFPQTVRKIKGFEVVANLAL